MPELDARMCWNHIKNNCFCDISLFQCFHDFGVSRGVFGPHFGGFGDTWVTILVILEVPGEVLKFQWILGYPLGHPWGRALRSGRLKVDSRGLLNRSQIPDC